MGNLNNVSIDGNIANVPDTYTKQEVDDMIASVTGVDFQVVGSLPATGDPGTIYLVPAGGGTYAQWVYTGGTWIQLGSVDMTNYYTKTQADARFYPYSGGTVTGATTWKNPDDTANNHFSIGTSSSSGSNYFDQYDSGYRVRVWPNSLSADRNIRWPDKAGTVALKSDIPAFSYSNSGDLTVFAPSGTSWGDMTITASEIDIGPGMYILGAYARFPTKSGRCALRIAYNTSSPATLGTKFLANNAFISGSSYAYLQVVGAYNNSTNRTIFPSLMQTNTAGDGMTVTYGIWALRLGDAL